jgi:hypothetical protein
MIQLIPGHGWADLAGVAALMTVAFAVFFGGMIMISARLNRST